MSRIYWDTMLYIYWLDDHPEHGPKIDWLFNRMNERGDVLCASSFTLAELLVGPKKQNDDVLEAKIGQFFNPPQVQIFDFDRECAIKFSEIRSVQKVSPADAIHLACACRNGVELFLTNDLAVRKLTVPGIQFIDGLDTSVFGPR